MENVKFETSHQIIINFYQNFQAKEKPYTVAHFAKMNVPRRTVYNNKAWYESGNTYKQGEGAGQPKKLKGVQERKVLKKKIRMKARLPLSTEQPTTRFFGFPPLNQFH